VIPDLSFAFHSTQTGAGNMINYQNEEMDRLLETAFSAPNEREKKEAWNRLQDHITSELPYISLLFKEHAVMHQATLKGELQPTQFNIFRGIETSYLIRTRDNTAADQ
jgi:peptide/nickel transport system substrate-binding protein